MDIGFIRNTILRYARETQKSWLEKEFCWGEYTTCPAVSGILRLEDGWYAWSNSDHSEAVFTGPIPDADVIAYLFNLKLGLEVEGYTMDMEKADHYLTLPRYRSLEEIRGGYSGTPSA